MRTMHTEKRVVLFGRTGEGKSTVANALVTGGIETEVFKSSDSAQGCTTDIKTETGRGWKVTDTLGVGEAEVGTVSTTEARKKLSDFLTNVKDSYSHIIYVQKASRRFTELDETIWNIFEMIFQGAEKAFIILFTDASERWVDEHRELLPSYMRNHTILGTDIPPIIRTRPVTERRNRKIRDASIEKLVQDLEAFFYKNECKYVTPQIASMNDEQLQERTESIWALLIKRIKAMFPESSWQTVAKKFSTLVDVVDFLDWSTRR